MARQDKHLVVWFNPWEYSNRETMWRAFVVEVYRVLEEEINNVPGASSKKAKEWVAKASGIGKVVSGAAGFFNESAGKALDAGMEILKNSFSFGESDLKKLQSFLGERKLFI